MYFRCLGHNDHDPSASINVDSGKWFCPVCAAMHGEHLTTLASVGGDVSKLVGGNLTTLAARRFNITTAQAHARISEGDLLTPVVLNGRPPHVRKDESRCGGSDAEHREQLTAAETLKNAGHSEREIVRILMDTFGISRATAYRRAGITVGRLVLRDGYLVRSFKILRRIRESGREHLRCLQDELNALALKHLHLQEGNLRRISVEHGMARLSKLLHPRKRKITRPPPTVMLPNASGRPVKSKWHPLFNPEEGLGVLPVAA